MTELSERYNQALLGRGDGLWQQRSRGVSWTAIAVMAFCFALATAGTSNAAKAASCNVPDNGIPDGIVLPENLASLGGLRPALAKYGIAISGSYTGEYYGDIAGGMKRTGAYDGVLNLALDADMHKLGLWKGLCFHANMFQIHGRGITARGVGSLAPISNLEARPATRLFEMYFDQSLDDGKISVRFGKIAADSEFAISDGGSYFVNGTWGWPTIWASDMTDGGPAYPIATPGVRVALHPNDNLNLMAAVFAGDIVDPNNDGLDFTIKGSPLLMAEASYKYNAKGGLPGQVKFGGWTHFGRFHDLRYDANGYPIAITGMPGKLHADDYGLYGTIDQLVWRVPGSSDPQGIGVFGRVMGAPSNTNLVDFYADTGITFTGMIPGRPDDALAVGFAYTNISSRQSGYDRDAGLPVVQDYESLMEVSYTYQIRDGWTVQPDFQYIWHPGGNVPNRAGTGPVKDAAVIGVRSTLNF